MNTKNDTPKPEYEIQQERCGASISRSLFSEFDEWDLICVQYALERGIEGLEEVWRDLDSMDDAKIAIEKCEKLKEWLEGVNEHLGPEEDDSSENDQSEAPNE